MELSKEWSAFHDLTVLEGGYLLIGADLKYISLRSAYDDEYDNFCSHRGWIEEAYEKCEQILSAVRAKAVETTTEFKDTNGEFDCTRTRILNTSFSEWCSKHGYKLVADALNNSARRNFSDESGVQVHDKGEWIVKAKEIANSIGKEKWDKGIKEITGRNICDAVADELGKDTRNHGNRGARSSSDVRNRGLRGWKFSPTIVDQMEQMDQTGSDAE